MDFLPDDNDTDDDENDQLMRKRNSIRATGCDVSFFLLGRGARATKKRSQIEIDSPQKKTSVYMGVLCFGHAFLLNTVSFLQLSQRGNIIMHLKS